MTPVDKKALTTLAAILILAAVGLYATKVVKDNQSDEHILELDNTPSAPADPTADWQRYRNEKYGFDFKYPPKLTLSAVGNKVTLSHSVAFRHTDPCDMKDGSAIDKVVDFNANFEVFKQPLKETIFADQHNDSVIADDIMKYGEKYSSGTLQGLKYYMGAEGCGVESYYFSLDESTTLSVKRFPAVETTPIVTNSEKYLALPGIIDPATELKFFNQILSTFKYLK